MPQGKFQRPRIVPSFLARSSCFIFYLVPSRVFRVPTIPNLLLLPPAGNVHLSFLAVYHRAVCHSSVLIDRVCYCRLRAVCAQCQPFPGSVLASLSCIGVHILLARWGLIVPPSSRVSTMAKFSLLDRGLIDRGVLIVSKLGASVNPSNTYPSIPWVAVSASRAFLARTVCIWRV